MGFEPTTTCLASKSSTTELPPQSLGASALRPFLTTTTMQHSNESSLVSIEELNLTAVVDMTPVISVTVSKPALTYLVEYNGIEPLTS